MLTQVLSCNFFWSLKDETSEIFTQSVAVSGLGNTLDPDCNRHLHSRWQVTAHALRLPVRYYDLPHQLRRLLHQLRCCTTVHRRFVLLQLLVAITIEQRSTANLENGDWNFDSMFLEFI